MTTSLHLHLVARLSANPIRSRRASITLSVIATFMVVSGASRAASASCWPTGGGYRQNYWFRANEGQFSLSIQDMVRDAVNEWGSAIMQNDTAYPDYSYDWYQPHYGTGGVQVTYVLEPTLGEGVWGIWNPATNTIHISAETLQYSNEFIYATILHEMGHALGYDHSDDGCTCQTIMQPFYGPDNFCYHLGSQDWQITYWSYPPAPPWCNPTDCSPIIIDMSGDGLHLTGPEVMFDISGAGLQQFGWPEKESDDGFLAFDRDGDGLISTGVELFGNFTPLSWTRTGPRAINGFAALAWFDAPEQGGNSDGVIDPGDHVWDSLEIWHDVNHDGVSQPEELSTVQAAGILAIEYDSKEFLHRYDQQGNLLRYRARVKLRGNKQSGNGREMTVFSYDVFLTSAR